MFAFTCLALFTGIVLIEILILNNKGNFKLTTEQKYIILGHSHAQMDYDDKYIDSSENLASSGEAYFYTYIKLRKILQSNKEKKVLFIEFTNNNIVKEMNNWIWDDMHLFDRYRLYSAYTHLNERKLLYMKNPYTASMCDIKSVVNNVYYIFALKHIASDGKMGGYLKLVRNKTDSLIAANAIHPNPMDTNISVANVFYLKKIIELCREYGTTVYLIRSPLHAKYEGYGNEFKFRELLNKDFKGVEFLDFANYYVPNSEFGDLEHLNFVGAKKYSLFFNSLIKQGLLDKPDKQKFIDEQLVIERNGL